MHSSSWQEQKKQRLPSQMEFRTLWWATAITYYVTEIQECLWGQHWPFSGLLFLKQQYPRQNYQNDLGIWFSVSLFFQPAAQHSCESRSRRPTSLVNGESNLPLWRHETLSFSAISGASEQNLTPAFDGMFDTLQKRCWVETLANYLFSNKTLTESVVSKCYKKTIDVYKNSEDNIKRSIATFYSSGVMGKRKYQSVRLALWMKSKNWKRASMSVIPGCRLSKVLPYNELVKEVNKIDIRKVYGIDFLKGLEVEATINGSYKKICDSNSNVWKTIICDKIEMKTWNGFLKQQRSQPTFFDK